MQNLASINHLHMKLKIYLLVPIIVALFSLKAGAQTRALLEEEAYGYLNTKNYAKAYEAFDKLYAKYPKEMLYEFNLGVCCLNYVPKKDRAVEIFRDLRTKYQTLEVETYLGYAYHRNYKFDDALNVLRPLIPLLGASTKQEDKDLLEQVKLTIQNCESAKTLMQNKVIANIQNIGAPINSAEIEGVPIITADESIMIFTYVGERSMGGKVNYAMKQDPNGEYLSDIFMSRKDSSGTKWMKPEPIAALNTNGNDAAIALSPDGLTLFTFRSDNKSEGDIFVSKYTGSSFTTPVPLNANINTPDQWEGSCSISADGRQLYFSSEREGGYGGRDLYVSELVNGDWGPAVNLGPKINTPYDDDAPFIHPDGITLFFSSKGHTSIGGYDIMYTVKEGNDWIAPRSMGVPLNTVEDDSYYVINSKGDKGYFSSTRDYRGALGEQDIYFVTPGILGEKPVVALLKGNVFGNDKPIEAKIEVTKIANSESIGPYYSQSETGKYLMALRPGFVYRLIVTADGYAKTEEDFDVETLSTYMEKKKDFYLYSENGAAPAVAPAVATTKETPASPEPVAEVKPATEVMPVNETPNIAPEPVVEKIETKKVVEPAIVEKPVAQVVKKKEVVKKEVVKKEVVTPEPVTSRSAKVSSACNSSVADLSGIKGQSLNDPQVYKQLMELMGNYCADNIRFTVQIGAYKNAEHFKYENLKSLGKVSSVIYPDDLTRFTQNEFTTLKSAEVNRQKAINRGVKDAWIVAFVNGQRYTLEDLIMANFMGNPIN